MNVTSIVQGVVQELQHTSWIEIVAVFFGALSVIFSNQNKVYLYPTGLISSGIFIVLLIRAKLYADAGLNAYYVIMSIYGWYVWTRKSAALDHTPVSWTSKKELRTAILIAGLGWIVLFGILKTFTDSNVPLFDAFVSATAWSGMWLLAKRKVENWVLLNISNFASVPLLVYKHLYFTTALTIFLFIVACFGFVNWKKIAAKEAALS